MSTSHKKSKKKIPVKMAKLNSENLFLLEFLIDELKMEAKCDCTSQGELCVSFQFLDNEALDVCEGDFNGENKFGEDNRSKTGKSCLFSLTPDQAKAVMKKFDVVVTVFKKMPPGWQPERTIVGSVNVPVVNLFLDLLSSKDPMASAKVLQESYKLLDANKVCVGRIGVYIRMSCYGKMIITQFQMNMKDKSVLFKDKDGHSLYRYKKSKKGRATRIEDLTNGGCTPNSNMMYNQGGQCPLPNNMGGQCPLPGNSMQGYPGTSMGYPGQGRMPQCLPPPNPNCPMQPCFPPPNPNCPTQPCYPDYGNPMQDMGMGGFGAQCPPQVTFAACPPQPKTGCGGGCSKR